MCPHHRVLQPRPLQPLRRPATPGSSPFQASPPRLLSVPLPAAKRHTSTPFACPSTLVTCALSSSRTSALSTLSLTSAATASGCGCACPGGCVARPSPAPSPQSLPEGSSSRPSSTDAGTAGSDAMRETRPWSAERRSGRGRTRKAVETIDWTVAMWSSTFEFYTSLMPATK
eukprot:363384-Chlamydomonas_euryale.AAC.30